MLSTSTAKLQHLITQNIEICYLKIIRTHRQDACTSLDNAIFPFCSNAEIQYRLCGQLGFCWIVTTIPWVSWVGGSCCSNLNSDKPENYKPLCPGGVPREAWHFQVSLATPCSPSENTTVIGELALSWYKPLVDYSIPIQTKDSKQKYQMLGLGVVIPKLQRDGEARQHCDLETRSQSTIRTPYPKRNNPIYTRLNPESEMLKRFKTSPDSGYREKTKKYKQGVGEDFLKR